MQDPLIQFKWDKAMSRNPKHEESQQLAQTLAKRLWSDQRALKNLTLELETEDTCKHKSLREVSEG